MKRRTAFIILLIVVIEVLAGLLAKHYAGIDWQTIDQQQVASDGKVDCTIDGYTARVTREVCGNALERSANMSPL